MEKQVTSTPQYLEMGGGGLVTCIRYSYIPEGTFLPRKEGSFLGRKIFVRKEAFK